MPYKPSSKASQTKYFLQEALISLCEQKPIDQIRIQELSELAGYNRGTFYLYYQDIYDLREQIEENLITFFKNNALPLIHSLITGDSIQNFANRLQYLEQNRRRLGVMLSDNGDPAFTKKLIDLAKNFITQTMNLPADNKKCQYALEYIAYAHISIIREWLVGKIEFSSQELLEFFLEILHKGPMTVLKENSK
ncbi:MAG: TetR/AcrR family transcriptional regulator [Clostridia bacterium]|nr:TetR/AcrR family transcriptional regulator [Clostridia bacterium]MDD4798728.1 TetR/AcrR family transcriptional regulator [Clostridia bacterium]